MNITMIDSRLSHCTQLETFLKATDETAMSMSQMVKELEGKTADEFDKTFIKLMIDHHQGAIDMAREAQKSAKHEEIKELADDIIEAQTKEIEMMEEWNKSWGYKK